MPENQFAPFADPSREFLSNYSKKAPKFKNNGAVSGVKETACVRIPRSIFFDEACFEILVLKLSMSFKTKSIAEIRVP